MKTNKALISRVKQMEGVILGFGINDEEVLKTIEKNDKITVCNLLDDIKKGTGKGKKGKKINLKKLRKKFKKKKTNYLICNRDIIKKDFNSFIKDSIYLTKDKIYFITKEKEEILKKYSRYNVLIEEVKCNDGFLITIDVNNEKNHIIKEFYYGIFDFVTDLIDVITNLLLN